MNIAIKTMLEKYNVRSEHDYINALKEIFQEIALLGLWRAKFFEKAAFYGGTALRILYGLNRFSEDLDFTLLKPNRGFDLVQYNQHIIEELNSFGFEVSVEIKQKTKATAIQSAFLKASTKQQLLVIRADQHILDSIHHMHTIKIKMEVDTNPPGLCETEAKNLLVPIPFSIRTVTKPDLFAGKIHAILCRPWQVRVKGRDWYDLIWYIGHDIAVNLAHLKDRLIQSEAWEPKKPFTRVDLRSMLEQKINDTNFNNAKKDILPFIQDKNSLNVWSNAFFLEMVNRIKT